MLHYYSDKKDLEVTATTNDALDNWVYVSILNDYLSEAVTLTLQGNGASSSGFAIAEIEWGRP